MADMNEIAKQPGGDGMPIGNVTQLPIKSGQAQETAGGKKEVAFDDTAAATIAWNDYQSAMNWLDQNSWLMEWQYIDYLYQSPNYDRDSRGAAGRPARIARFNVAKNRNTMSCQTRRAVFGDDNWFVLEARGKLAGRPDAELVLNAWTELFMILSDRAELEYNMRLFIECQSLQGTAIAIPGWEERTVMRSWREPKEPPQEIDMPAGGKKKIHTFASDDWDTKTKEVTESWPFFEYRRLGTTFYSEKWKHPGRPDLSGWPRIDVDYVNFQDLQQMRELDCYQDIPSDDDLKKFFLDNPNGDADPGPDVVQNMNANSTMVMHAEGDNAQTSLNPFVKPLLKIAYWTQERVIELLVYNSRRKVIRNEEHGIGDHAAGYSACWCNIDNSGYGFGIGRMNAGDQRMSQGVLNEVLKMIAFPLNAPILYDSSSNNAPTQNTIAGLGLMLGIDPGKSGDVNKALRFMEMPQVPAEAWKVYQLAQQGGEQLVGADQAMMQGQMPGVGSSIGRTATGASRMASKADDAISDPVDAIEQVLTRWLQFLWKAVREVMPIKEIRAILSEKYSEAVLDSMDAVEFLDAKFEIKVLCGRKLAAKAAIAQLIPFLLQILQQPQILQFYHQIGMTINYAAIANLFLRMSELATKEDIFIPLTPQQQQTLKQMQPGIQKAAADMQLEQVKGQNKLQEIEKKGEQDMQQTLVEKAMDHVDGAVPLEQSMARYERNADLNVLNHGPVL